jgi:hypothetical protein
MPGKISREVLLCVVEAKSRISFPFNIERAGTNHFENPYALTRLPDIFNTLEGSSWVASKLQKERTTGK